MATQGTIDAADAVVDLLNAATLTESITFSRTFIPKFEPNDLSEAKGLVLPASIELSIASRAHDQEDSIVEIGIGRKIADESLDPATQIATVEEVKTAIRDQGSIITPAESIELNFSRLEAVLFVPDLLKKRVALSVIRVVYRGFV